MIASAHIAAGALAGIIGTRARSAGTVVSVLIATALGIGSHMVMDAIPHSEYLFVNINHAVRVAVVEAILACGLAWLVLRRRAGHSAILPVAAGIIAGILPDVQFASQVMVLPGAPQFASAGDVFHILHASKAAPPIAGVFGELTLATIFFFLAARLARRAPVPGALKAEATPN